MTSKFTNRKIEVMVRGMTCSGCVLTIEKAVKSIAGVKEANADLSTGRIYIISDYSRRRGRNLALEIYNKIEEKGYKVATDKLIIFTDFYSVQENDVLALKNLNGIISVKLRKALGEIEIDFIQNIISEKEIKKELEKIGVRIKGELSSSVAGTGVTERDKSLILKLAVALPIAVLFIADMIFHLHFLKNGWIQLTLSTPVVIFSASEFTKGFLRKFVKLSFDMNILISLGVLTAYIFSTVDLIFLSSGDLYYESAAVITAFVLFGRFIESKIRSNTVSAFLKLKEIEPRSATILRENQEVRTDVDDLTYGDLVILREGERAPADGILQKGEVVVDESHITGEISYSSKFEGDYIFAGSLVYRGWGIMLVKEVGDNTTLYSLISAFKEAQLKKSQIERFVDKISAVFVPAIILLSFGTFLFWIYTYDLIFAVERAISVLVIACPCALGLATPTAVASAVNRFLKKGIAIKNPTVFETIPFVQTVVFDKTGTLTEGRLGITNIYIYKEGKMIRFEELQEEEKSTLKSILASTELTSEHKIAKAILEFAKDTEIKTPASYFSLKGKGVFAKINGAECVIGNEKIFSELNIKLPDFSTEILKNGDATYVFFSVNFPSINKEISGVIFFRDKIKKDAEDVIRYLKHLNKKIVIITGDRRQNSEYIGRNLGADEVFSEVLPEEKVKIIESLKNSGDKIMMVGDGVNDSPSILSADIGVSIQDASEISKASADIVIQELGSLKELFSISKFVSNVIKQNLAWAFIYNASLIPIAAGALSKFGIVLNPMLSSLAMSLSSISVVLNSLRILKK